MTTASDALKYWKETIIPSIMEAWIRLDVPSWEIYSPVFQESVTNVWNAIQSWAQLSYLTFRPFVILCGMILEVLWKVAQVVFQVLLSRGWIELKRGSVQVKEGVLWFCRFQMSLSRIELLGELLVVAVSIALFYLYKWIRTQTYWRRFVQWYSLKKRKAMNVSTGQVALVVRYAIVYALSGNRESRSYCSRREWTVCPDGNVTTAGAGRLLWSSPEICL